ncbi:MAG: GNAT family N-acetyltransferase [Hormoscilla sp.]
MSSGRVGEPLPLQASLWVKYYIATSYQNLPSQFTMTASDRSKHAARVIDLPASRHSEATTMLADTLAAQPTIDYLFRVTGDRKRQVTRLYLRLFLDMLAATGQPLWAVMLEDRVIGLAAIYEPAVTADPWGGLRLLVRLTLGAGLPAVWRLLRLMMAVEPHYPTAPYYHLVMLAVHPDFQGLGFGRQLLDRIHALSESHPTSTGVWVETDTQQNILMYEHFGYMLKEKLKLSDDFELSLLFRPNTAT